jgi:hypothetical protein
MERDAKVKAKASREKARKESIVRTAEFEHSDRLEEDVGEATPRPPFTPKPRPLSRYQKQANPHSVIGSSDVEMVDDSDITSLTEDLVTEYDSAAENDPLKNPPKKQKANATKKPIVKIGGPVTGKTAEKRKRVERDAEETIASGEEETPKPKKVKVKMRDEINLATKEIVETEAKGNLYSDMVKSKSTTQVGRQAGSKQAPKVASAANGGRKLKREGAMLHIYEDFAGRNKGTSANISKNSRDGISDKGDRFV